MGPVTNDILQLAREFGARQRHEVTVADLPSERPRPRFPARCDLLEFPVDGRVTRHEPTHEKILSTLAQEAPNFDVVHVHEPSLAVMLADMHPVTVYTCHTPNNWAGIVHRRGFKGMRDRLKLGPWLRSKKHDLEAICRVNTTIGLGDHLARAVRTIMPGAANRGRIVTIQNGVDPEQWPDLDRSSARQALGVARGFRLVIVGRLIHEKGLHVLLEAASSLAERIPGLHIDVIGAGEDSPYARSLQHKHERLSVTYHGFVSNRESRFQTLMAAADLMVLPSIRDNQPNVVMEGMVMGVPVVGSRVGGVPGMISDSVGRLFDVGDSEGLATIIEDLYHHPESLARMGTAAKRHVAKQLSWSRSARRHLDLFRHLAA